ncbi:MAG: SEC-C metal-binding domain-containing protein, partial [Nitrospinota bacterium]
FTGRLMTGRRWSDGLHQAVEAKEGVKIENENQTLASVTFQNYFRLYKKLSGMTGTADTEAAEFQSIYSLEVVLIPSNKPVIRKDYADLIYRTNREKFSAISDEIEELNKKGQPVLVGTISINNSELISKFLKKKGVAHKVLNAKFHEQEAEIVAQAGRLGSVTIATNMAGRGTDIVLGGNPEFMVKRDLKRSDDAGEKSQALLEKYTNQCAEEKLQVLEAGGLHILGTERHESRRIDNQLRGRSGRQGDPGSSRFFLSLEDDLLRIFGSERISGIMEKLGMEEGEPIEHSMISKAIENAQKKVEGHNFSIRKHLLEYDDVMSKQREVLYSLRRKALSGDGTREMVLDMADEVLAESVPIYVDPSKHPDDWDLKGLTEYIQGHFGVFVRKEDENLIIPGAEPVQLEEIDGAQLLETLQDALVVAYDNREKELGSPEMLRHIEKVIMLQVIDAQWKDHLLTMDHLKEGIGFRGYAQKNPLNEYKREGFDLFSGMILRIKEEVTQFLFKVQVSTEDDLVKGEQRAKKKQTAAVVEHRGEPEQKGPARKAAGKVGRNDPCSCGSGKKYKKCCGKV